MFLVESIYISQIEFVSSDEPLEFSPIMIIPVHCFTPWLILIVCKTEWIDWFQNKTGCIIMFPFDNSYRQQCRKTLSPVMVLHFKASHVCLSLNDFTSAVSPFQNLHWLSFYNELLALIIATFFTYSQRDQAKVWQPSKMAKLIFYLTENRQLS